MLKIFWVLFFPFYLMAEDYSALINQPLVINFKHVHQQMKYYIEGIREDKNIKGHYVLSVVSTQDMNEARSPHYHNISKAQLDILLQLHRENMGRMHEVESNADIVRVRMPKDLFVSVKDNLTPRVTEVGLYFDTGGKQLLYPLKKGGYQELETSSEYQKSKSGTPYTYLLKPFEGYETITVPKTPEEKARIKEKLKKQTYYLKAGAEYLPIYVIGSANDEEVLIIRKDRLNEFLEGKAELLYVPFYNIEKSLSPEKYAAELKEIFERTPAKFEKVETLFFRTKGGGYKATLRPCTGEFEKISKAIFGQ
jgi:hypothetical protein